MLGFVRRVDFVGGGRVERGVRKVCVRVLIVEEKRGRRTEGGGIVVGRCVRWVGSACSCARR